MLSLRSLFKETKDDLNKDQKKHKGRANKYIKDMSALPELKCPEVGSIIHDRDVELIKHYFYNKSLPDEFLKIAHKDCKTLFKNFCKQNNYKINWKLIKDGLKDSHAIIFSLKNKFKRPRPKNLLKLESDEYNNIFDMDSYSFPSGHTTTAFFIATVLSDVLPEEHGNFKTLAELIGQSRIENCVHYPSDVIHGQLLGELLGQLFLNEINDKKHDITKISVKRKDEKQLSEKLRKKANELYSENYIKQYCHDVAEFIQNSCKLEQINVQYNDCYKECYDFINGYPLKDIKNDNVRSHLQMMCMANKLKDLDSVFGLINLHRQLAENVIEKGQPGMFRYFNRSSSYGNEYSYPNNIITDIQKLSKINNPYIKHIIYEWIHPFCDGNGRSGRVKLLFDLNIDFKAANKFCSNDYLKKIHLFIDKYKSIDIALNQ